MKRFFLAALLLTAVLPVFAAKKTTIPLGAIKNAKFNPKMIRNDA